MEMDVRYFSVWDYVVFSVMLCVSAGIGLYYACTGGKQSTQKEFLMADKSMSTLPVVMSLLASFVSAITVLGSPAEVYRNGTMFWFFAVSGSLSMVLVARLFVPTFYNLGLTSTYEYLEIRFSKPVRLLCTVLFVINMLVYMGLVLYTPSLALNAVTGLTLWGAVLGMGFVCTFYTALGGMKAVMWTDTFQVFVMVAGFLAVIIQGTIEAGGPTRVWELNRQGQRLEFFNFDPDPRVRHTTWNILVGGTFFRCAMYAVNQAQVQRYLSCPSIKKAQQALYWNILGLIMFIFFAVLSGMVMYARYFNCDPKTMGYIQNSDQMMPYFVMDILSQFPGMPGLFTSCVFSAALSTMSSGLNALAAVALEDFVKPCFPNLSDERYTWISKVLAMAFGLLTILMAFIASYLGPVFSAVISLFGMIGGPILGIFVLGMMFPCANKWGGLVGLVCSLVLTLWIGMGAIVWPRARAMPPVSTEGCSANITANFTSSSTMSTMAMAQYSVTTPAGPTDNGYPPEAALYELSYVYLGAVATLSCVIVGLLVSFVTGSQDPKTVDPRLIVPFYDSMFCCLPNSWLEWLRCGVRHGEEEKEAVDIPMTTATSNPTFSLGEDTKEQGGSWKEENGVSHLSNGHHIVVDEEGTNL
ncbi:sodium-coupled monocarboxylate transporter 1-like [Branchiostoma floridae]|uniref:Sodium-coupled monocarboxylate transporter 1-like n=2 Tax=Branchiostoma floridae TaxID=7739 RepID=A0A9J7LQC4_BRAFL|nr:sodium-coupled monocarboxylate transporter 1-like [Branchiostoma floridae]